MKMDEWNVEKRKIKSRRARQSQAQKEWSAIDIRTEKVKRNESLFDFSLSLHLVVCVCVCRYICVCMDGWTPNVVISSLQSLFSVSTAHILFLMKVCAG